MKRITIRDEAGKDISDLVELVNKKSNPFGWSSADFSVNGEIIGYHESGSIRLKEPYTFTESEEEE